MAVLVLILIHLSISAAQSINSSSLDCNDIVWSDVNTTNTTRLSEIFQQCLNDNLPYEDCPDSSLCDNGITDSKNVALAFGLTIGAGLATTLGALVPFVPCIKRSDTKFLAISLSLAGGVMLFISFTEILRKSRDYLCCVTQTHYDLVSYCCFFVGITLTVFLDLLVLGLERIDCGVPSLVESSCCRRITNRRLSQSSTNRDVPLEEERGVSHVNGVIVHQSSNMVTDVDDNFVPSSNNSPTLLQHADLSIPDNDLQTERR